MKGPSERSLQALRRKLAMERCPLCLGLGKVKRVDPVTKEVSWVPCPACYERAHTSESAD